MAGYLHGVETIEIDDGIRPIQTVRSSVIGLIGTAPDADADKFPLNMPVLIPGRQRDVIDLGATGTLKNACDGIFDQGVAPFIVIVRVAEGVDEDATLLNMIGDAADFSGVHAFKAAESIVKVTPRILCAPGFTHQRPGAAANPVIAEILGLADILRAVVIADAPGASTAAAIAYRQDFDSARLYIVAPGVKVFRGAGVVVEPASARVAGLIVRRDKDKGFWWSPSNQPLGGVVGIERPIDFALNNGATESNLLNENGVASVIHHNGYRLWGNKSAATDPIWQFLTVRRTADLVYDSVERSMLWAMDRPLSQQLVEDVGNSVNAYLRNLTQRGALLGGRAWLDPEINTPADLKAGKLSIDFDLEPPAPLDRLTFRARRNDGYYEELVNAVSLAA